MDTGIGVHYRDLALIFKQLGHKVRVYQFPYEFTHDTVSEFEGVPVSRFGIRHTNLFKIRGIGRLCRIFRYFDFYEALVFFRRSKAILKEAIKEHDFDIIEATSNRGVACSISFVKKKPPIFTRVSTTMKQSFAYEGKTVDLNYRLASYLECSQIRRSDYLVTHTRCHAREIGNLHGINPDKFRIIPHAIESKQSFNIKHKISDDSIKILFVGRMEPRKGFDTLLRAIPKVLERFSNVHFDFCGSSEKSILDSAEKRLSSESRVTFHGYVERNNLNKFYKNCDIFVAPSIYESFGMIYLEAMRFGKPVVACNSGGTPEVVENGISGILVSPSNADQLANALIRLCTSESLRKKMGQAGQIRISKFYSLDKLGEATLNHYQSFCGSGLNN